MLFKEVSVKLHTALAVLLWMVQESGWQVHGSWPFESASSSFHDKRLSGSTIKTLFKPLNRCFMECSSHPRCHSINFHVVSSLCELNEETHLSDPDALSHLPHVVYMMYAMRELPYCSQKRALGMEDKSIPNIAITASSTYKGRNHRYLPSEGRLRNTRDVNVRERSGCWAPINKSNSYFQVDLSRVMLVSGIATQGNKWTRINEYVTTYSVAYSLDGTNWEDYKEENSLKVFNGNTESTSIVTNSFSREIKARYMRVLPLSWESWPSLRVEFYGCSL